MKAIRNLFGIATMALLLMYSVAFAAEKSDSSTEIIPMVNDGTKIVINLANRGLYLFERGEKTRLYPIACGAPYDPTPIGYYKVVEKTVNPTWQDSRDPSSVIPAGPDNPLGYRWIGIGGYYGIHGTNNPSSIGSYASRGCIRMLEKDVEELFDRVAVGTPVEIFYNRIVVEKASDDRVAYYIYPDSYNCQPITVEQVNNWLRGFGVSGFENDEAILNKIKASDGLPTYIAKVYRINLDGKTMTSKAVEKEGMYYLPVQQMADEMGLPIFYDKDNGIVTTSYGTAAVYDFKGILYLNSDDAENVLNVYGGKSGNMTITYHRKN